MKTYLSKDQMMYAENEEEATAYVALKMMFDNMLTKDKDEVEISFNLKQLYYQLSGTYDIGRYDKPKLAKGIKGLISADVLKLIDTDGKDEYTVDAVGLNIDTSREVYTMMDREEIRNIFNITCKNHFNLLRFAIGLFGTINSYNKCGWTSFNTMPQVTNVSERTCEDYFKLLEENNIIYVCHSKQAKRDSNGQIKNLSNVYGRPSDKESIDSYYEQKANNEGYDFTKNIDSIKRGLITRKYNKFVNNNFNGDVIELIRDVLAYNEQPYQAKHPEYQKDITVFNSDMIAKAYEGMKAHWKEIRTEQKEKEKQEEKELKERQAFRNFDSSAFEENFDNDIF